jgi:hypothetical protein
MKVSFTIACVVATASAGIVDGLVDFVADFPISKADARAKYGAKYREFKTNPTHQQAVKEAHHNLRAQRERLGLPRIGADPARDEDVRKAYEDMNGLSAWMLGLTQGLQYSTSGSTSKCFDAVEGMTTGFSNLFYVLTRMYMPWYMGEAQLAMQDTIALFGSVYIECDVNKFFDSMTTLFSVEGVSSLGARGGGAYFF